MTLDETLHENWESLTEKQKEHIRQCHQETKEWYDKIVELINQPDYKQICYSARHTCNPKTDIKMRVLKPSIIKEGLEEMGEDILILTHEDLREIYLIAENTYTKLKYGQKLK